MPCERVDMIPPCGREDRKVQVTRKLAESRMLAYASGNFGKALVFGGADLTILFLLTDVLGLGGTTAGWVMLAALCGDLIFDLVAARLVIRLRHAGKGYRWMVAIAATPCALAFALLYAMPVLGARQLWMLAAALLVFRGEIGRAVQQECRDRSRMPSSA
eukprot:TRINITY_DN23381_c0_g1_i1.p1 TRINITY_DN23381_c0_g1~~TRINITY_DN23381_c0_g1_i1.p1  ORF type:complete len:160 (-),score=50.70 TRINITY_DN23381_c0_g1_i1:10-489(-)